MLLSNLGQRTALEEERMEFAEEVLLLCGTLPTKPPLPTQPKPRHAVGGDQF